MTTLPKWLRQTEEEIEACEGSTDYYLGGQIAVDYARSLLEEVKRLRKELAELRKRLLGGS